MARARKDPECSTVRVRLCDENLQVVNLVKAKLSSNRQANQSHAINYILAEWAEKNKTKLLLGS